MRSTNSSSLLQKKQGVSNEETRNKLRLGVVILLSTVIKPWRYSLKGAMRHYLKRVFRSLPLLFALTTPFLTLLIFKDLVSWDLNTFLQWAACLKSANGPVYAPCLPDLINYPTIGLWASAGALWMLEALHGPLYFQLYLGVIDALNILLMYLLLRGLGVGQASWLTLLFAALPSTRIGANLWGQIDDVSQLFLSLGFLCGLRGLKAVERRRPRETQRYLIALSLCIGCATLTKQLVFFSLPALAVLWLTLAVRATRAWLVTSINATWLFALGVTIFLDQLSPTPSGYFGSSLYYVLSTGSNHASTISAAGLNLYPLLHLPPTGSSKVAYTVFSLGNLQITIIPLYFGLTLFFTGCALSAWRLLRLGRTHKGASAIQTTTVLLLFAALCNLFMNTFFSGTHERYLYHYGFFAFPVVCLFAQRGTISRFITLSFLVHLTVYGLFVFSVLTGRQGVWWAIRSQEFVAWMNIAFSIYALWALTRASSKTPDTEEPNN